MEWLLYYDALSILYVQDVFYRLPYMETLAVSVTKLGDPRISRDPGSQRRGMVQHCPQMVVARQPAVLVGVASHRLAAPPAPESSDVRDRTRQP
jgi:hypothetical protein